MFLKGKEIVFKIIFLICALVSVTALAVICIYLLARGIPAIAEIGFFRFLFGTEWIPSQNKFGILPMIVNSIYVTAFSILFGIIIGVLAAVFLAKFCRRKMFKALRQMVNLLAGIPSVVYGFFGVQVIVPLMSQIAPSGNGFGLLASGLILGIMILPTVVSISLGSILNVDPAYYEGALALGATHEQAVFKVVVKAAKSGIAAGVILGITRAIGETMAVVMVSGNATKFADFFFNGFRTMTGNIVLEMGYATGLHLDALIATGVVLFVFVLILIISFNLLRGRKKKPRKIELLSQKTGGGEKIRFCKTPYRVMKWLTAGAMAFAIFFLAFICGFILFKGLPHITGTLLFGEFTWGGPVTLLPAFVTTLLLIAITLLIAIPIGVFTAVYLTEYTKRGSKLVKIIRSALETLSGIPSIVYGLFGMVVFGQLFHMGYSILNGCLTLSIMVMPLVVRTTEESLREVPDSLREAALSLGAGKIRTVFKIVLPSAVSGIATGIILSTGRILGESAAVLFTVGSTPSMPAGLRSGGVSLAVYIYVLAGENMHLGEAFAAAAVILILAAALNLLSSFAESRFLRRRTKYDKIEQNPIREEEEILCYSEAIVKRQR